MLPAISPQEAFERFSKGEARLVDIRETDEYTQEFVPGSSAIRATVPPTLPICWSASPATCRPIVLTEASPAGRRRGFPWSISPQPSLCSVRFRSRPVPWCSSASSAVPSGIRSSGCPPLSARGWSSPGFPGSAASACCFRTCRGTGVEPVIRKIKDSDTLCGVLPVWANRFSGIGSFSLRAF